MMAPFDPDADIQQAVDFRLAMHGFVALFWNPAVLDETAAWFTGHGYRVVQFDAAPWASEADLHRDLAAGLGFPDYYGANLDALNDSFASATSPTATTAHLPTATGLVLVLRRYDAFTARHRPVAQAVLDIVADAARSAALIGHRMLCLVQSDDPDIRFDPVGATPVFWNDAEWPHAKRHPVDSGPHRSPVVGEGQADTEADE